MHEYAYGGAVTLPYRFVTFNHEQLQSAMPEPVPNYIEYLHALLGSLENRVATRPTIVTGVQGVRIMRVVSMMSSATIHYAWIKWAESELKWQ